MMPPASPVLILGATSDIGRAIAHEYARAGFPLVLAARDHRRLAPDVADLRLRYQVPVEAVEFDLLDGQAPEAFLDTVGETPGTVICVAGLLGEQDRAQVDRSHARAIFDTNFVAPALLLDAVAQRMEQRGTGTIIGISSVAGDRGRASNYAYGAAKAGFSAFLSGLRNRLARRGVRVITVKPGFVATKMTAGMALPKALTAQPAEVARAVMRAHRGRQDVIYVRGVWRWIMLIIRSIPEALFKRLSI